MRQILIATALLFSISIWANQSTKIETIHVYKDNVLLLTDDKIKLCESMAMENEDLLFLQSIFDSIPANNSAGVAPAAGGLFCVLNYKDGKTMNVRIAANVIVARYEDKGKISYKFHTPREKVQLATLANLLTKYGKK